MDRLDGKVALITGGATGIGFEIARKFSEAGAIVIVCGRRQAQLESLASQSNAGGWMVDTIKADVSVVADTKRVVEYSLERHSRLDILVNNAAIDGGSQIHTHSIDMWDRIMAINLRGSFLMSRFALPVFRAQGSGHILMISSESSLNYYEGDGAYGVSKHALNALAEYIQVENQAFGVRVDTICPGMVITEMTKGLSGLNEERCLDPKDIADLACWLVTRRENIKIGKPILIQTMLNPWE